MFFGSPRDSGKCAYILGALLEMLKGRFSFSVVDAYKKAVEPCDDCNICKCCGKCRFRDMDDVYLSLKYIRSVIVVSPVYNCSFPAPLKAIFDRFQFYYNLSGKAFLSKKKVILVLTCGRKYNAACIRAVIVQAVFVFKSINADIKKVIIVDDTDSIK